MDEAMWTYQGRQTCRRPDGNPVTGEGYGPQDPPWKSRRARPVSASETDPYSQLPAPRTTAPPPPQTTATDAASSDVQLGAEGEGTLVEITEITEPDSYLGPELEPSPSKTLRPEDRPAAGVSSAAAQQQSTRSWFTGRPNRVPPGGFSSGLW